MLEIITYITAIMANSIIIATAMAVGVGLYLREKRRKEIMTRCKN